MSPVFDTSRLKLLPLADRKHDLDLSVILPLKQTEDVNNNINKVAEHILCAKKHNASVVLMMGAHVLRSGVQQYLIDLMKEGYISCIAMNGAGAIHDFEFALIGKTTECVTRYIKEGKFGLWKETGKINDIVTQGSREGLGLGESVGRAVSQGNFPHKDVSIFAAGYRLSIPVTVHTGIGYDITHEHPNFDGAAYGKTSYEDFLRFTSILENLENGVVMNFGSAVMAPEVFLKALAMVRNVAHQDGRQINKFTTLVCDLADIPSKYREEPCSNDHFYFFRPWKTMLVRTVADGGESYYVQGRHAQTVPQLWTAIKRLKARKLGKLD